VLILLSPCPRFPPHIHSEPIPPLYTHRGQINEATKTLNELSASYAAHSADLKKREAANSVIREANSVLAADIGA